jgi:hypothetical protein
MRSACLVEMSRFVRHAAQAKQRLARKASRFGRFKSFTAE